MKHNSILFFAFRSIFRQKMRNLFIVSIVCCTCVFSLFSAGLFEGKNKQIENAIINTETGVFQIIGKQFFEKSDPLATENLSSIQLNKANQNEFTPELILKTTILHPDGPQELTLIGIEPRSHENIFQLKKYVRGHWPLNKGRQKEIVIGQKFSEKLNLKIDDDLIITYQDKSKAIQNESLKVVGIFNYYGAGFESRNAYVIDDTVRTLLGIESSDSFHRLIFKKFVNLIPKSNFLKKTWQELYPELTVLMRLHDGITRTLIIFMLLIAYVSIFTPITILWEERKNEIKLLQTIGADSKTLYLLASSEALILTFISLAFSLVIWIVVHQWASIKGLDFSVLGESAVSRGGILISPIVYPSINLVHNIMIFIFHGFLIFLSQLWCIRKLLTEETLVG